LFKTGNLHFEAFWDSIEFRFLFALSDRLLLAFNKRSCFLP